MSESIQFVFYTNVKFKKENKAGVFKDKEVTFPDEPLLQLLSEKRYDEAFPFVLPIDKDNLIKNIALLTEADKYNYENKCPYQIILTTGIDTYPEDYKKFVFFKLEGEKYLLQENILEEKC